MPAGPSPPLRIESKPPKRRRIFIVGTQPEESYCGRAPKVREQPGQGLLLPCLERIGEGALAGQAFFHGKDGAAVVVCRRWGYRTEAVFAAIRKLRSLSASMFDRPII